MDEMQFRMLYERYFTLVGQSLGRYRLQPEEREDIVQATFVSLWVYAKENPVHRPAGFLVAAARNRAVSLLRRRKRQATDSLEGQPELCASRAPSGGGALGREADLREELIAFVQQALLENAQGAQDDTLWQRYVLGRKLVDIAASRGEPLGTVCARVNARRIPKGLANQLRAAALRIGETGLGDAAP